MIDRRDLALGGALALVGAALPPRAATAQNAASAPAQLAGTDPAKLMMMAHESGAFLLATGRLGMEKATRAEVKRFAQFETNEQEALVGAMKLAGHQPTATQFTGEKARMMEQLTTGSGPAFEQAFLKAQTTGHEEALNVFTAIAQSAAGDPDKIVATLTASRVQEHLIDLGQLQQS